MTRGRPRKDPNAPDPDKIGIERLKVRLREEVGVPMSHEAIHDAIKLHGLPAYQNLLHKNNQGEPIFLFVFEEVKTWLKGRVVRYVPPKSPASKIRDLTPLAKAR